MPIKGCFDGLTSEGSVEIMNRSCGFYRGVASLAVAPLLHAAAYFVLANDRSFILIAQVAH